MVEAGTLEPDRAVRLRKVTLQDVGLLMLWASSPRYTGEFNDFGLSRQRPYYELIAKDELIGPNGGTLMVERMADNEVLGRARSPISAIPRSSLD